MRNRSENQIEVYLIRHGATNANREHRYLGRTEELLSEEGREELKAFQRQGIYPDPASLQALFVSPMERCRETAELLFGDCEQHVIPEFRRWTLDSLKERIIRICRRCPVPDMD